MRILLLTFFLFFLASEASHAAPPFTLTFVGKQELPSTTEFEEIQVGGLSGITFDPGQNIFYAVTDDSRKRGRTRVYTLNLDYDASSFPQMQIAKAVVLQDAKGNPLPRTDAEGLAWMAPGEIAVAQEGTRDGDSKVPWIRRFNLVSGRMLQNINLPSVYLPRDKDGKVVTIGAGAQVSGVASNRSLESLAADPTADRLYTANEVALVQDIDDKQSGNGIMGRTRVRITEFSSARSNPIVSAQKVYETDPGALFDSVSDLVSMGDRRLLVLERRVMSPSLATGSYVFRIYAVNMDESKATDVQHVPALPGKAIRPLRKELVFDSGTAGLTGIDNIEGFCWGRIINGRRSLVCISDNNYSGAQLTQLLVFMTSLRE